MSPETSPSDGHPAGSSGGSEDISVIDLAGRSDAGELLGRIYHQVLAPSFRPDELDQLDAFVAALDEQPRNTDVAAALDASGEILGTMIADWDPQSRVLLLSYLAARPGIRSRGVGTRLMEHLPDWWRARQALVTVAEVDDPRRHTASSAVGDPEARLSFYTRFGGRVLDLPYFQPRLSPNGQRVHGMLLLAFGVDPDGLADGPAPALRGDLVAGFLRRYFAACEGGGGTLDDHADDPELSRLLEQASSPAGVPLLPIERYGDIAPDVEGPPAG